MCMSLLQWMVAGVTGVALDNAPQVVGEVKKLGPEDVIIQPLETEELRAEDRIVIHLIVTKFPVKVYNSSS